MPSDRAKAVIDTRWSIQRQQSRDKKNPKAPPDRTAELDAIAQFLAERGPTVLPPAEPAPGSGRRPGETAPRPMAGWRD